MKHRAVSEGGCWQVRVDCMVGHAADHLTCFIIIQALLSEEKLPPLDGILVGGKTLQYSKFALCLPRYCLSSLTV